jgi:hypothetical protein
MNSGDSLFHPMDKDAKRRRALASVYEFLLKLAEEAKDQPEVSVPDEKQDKNSAPLKQNIPS